MTSPDSVMTISSLEMGNVSFNFVTVRCTPLFLSGDDSQYSRKGKVQGLEEEEVAYEVPARFLKSFELVPPENGETHPRTRSSDGRRQLEVDYLLTDNKEGESESQFDRIEGRKQSKKKEKRLKRLCPSSSRNRGRKRFSRGSTVSRSRRVPTRRV